MTKAKSIKAVAKAPAKKKAADVGALGVLPDSELKQISGDAIEQNRDDSPSHDRGKDGEAGDLGERDCEVLGN